MKKLILTALCSLIVLAAGAQSIPSAILSKHKANETFTIRFSETKSMPKAKKETKKSGSLTFKAPEYLRLDYTDPKGDYTLIDKGLFETSRDGKVQKLPVKNAQSKTAIMRATLLMAMQGKVEEIAKQHGAKAEYKEAGGEYVCTLTNDQAKGANDISQMVLVYDKKSGQIRSLTIYNPNGNNTTYQMVRG